jgi:tetrahydromethanopterin S-methyltransferase subunit G
MKGEAMTSDDKVPQVMMTVADLLGLIDGLDPIDKETVFRNSFGGPGGGKRAAPRR